MALPIASCKAERNFSVPNKLTNFDQPCCRKDCFTFPILSIEGITKSLSYEETIKYYAAKKWWKKVR
jgi:hypothetical protein